MAGEGLKAALDRFVGVVGAHGGMDVVLQPVDYARFLVRAERVPELKVGIAADRKSIVYRGLVFRRSLL